jgi:hypothetical protein
VAGATFGFSNKVMRQVFLETERKKDRKQFLLISALVAAIGMMAAAVISFFNISVAQLFANQSPMQLSLFVAFGLAVLAAIQYADQRWVRK